MKLGRSEDASKKPQSAHRVSAIKQLLCSHVQPRVLIPTLVSCCEKLMRDNQVRSTAVRLLNVWRKMLTFAGRFCCLSELVEGRVGSLYWANKFLEFFARCRAG